LPRRDPPNFLPRRTCGKPPLPPCIRPVRRSAAASVCVLLPVARGHVTPHPYDTIFAAFHLTDLPGPGSAKGRSGILQGGNLLCDLSSLGGKCFGRNELHRFCGQNQISDFLEEHKPDLPSGKVRLRGRGRVVPIMYGPGLAHYPNCRGRPETRLEDGQKSRQLSGQFGKIC